MVQKTFGIYPESETAKALFIELGETHVVCWTVTDVRQISSFEFFNSDNETRTHVKEIFNEIKLHSKILDGSYANVSVILDNECCLLLPSLELSEEDKNSLLAIAFGESKNSLKKTSERQLTYLFSVHKQLHELLIKEFPNAEIHHKYEWLFHESGGSHAFDILLTCYLEHCIVSVKHDGQYLLVQRYNYETPDDVVYYLLNICKQLGIEPADMNLTVQGLVETESKLYAELFKYIPNIQLQESQALNFASDAFAEYPAHYFSSFVNAPA